MARSPPRRPASATSARSLPTLGSCTITSALNFADGVVLTGAIAAKTPSPTSASGFATAWLTVTLERHLVRRLQLQRQRRARRQRSSSPVEAQLERTSLWNTTYGSYKAPAQHVYRVLRDSTEVFRGAEDQLRRHPSAASGSRSYRSCRSRKTSYPGEKSSAGAASRRTPHPSTATATTDPIDPSPRPRKTTRSRSARVEKRPRSSSSASKIGRPACHGAPRSW